MEISTWLSEMGMEDSDLIDEYEMNAFYDLAAAFHQPSSSECPPPLEPEANQTPFDQSSPANQNYAPRARRGRKRGIAPHTTPESHTQDHIIAERKRRAKLSQQFTALSAIVPGLKKMDKTSVLGDTIKYLRELQERVKTLEEQSANKTTESVVFIRKFHILSDDDTPSIDDNSDDEPLPEIEARVSGKNVLIHIHCEKQKGVYGKTLDAIEELNLSVANSSIIPFGTSTLYMTVVAQMGEDVSLSVKGLLKKLGFLYFVKPCKGMPSQNRECF